MTLQDTLTPSAGYYTIKQLPQEKSSEAIVYAPEGTKQFPFVKGTIIKAGDELITDQGGVIAPQYKPGDIVLYNFSEFEEIREKGETIHLIRFRSVIAKYEI